MIVSSRQLWCVSLFSFFFLLSSRNPEYCNRGAEWFFVSYEIVRVRIRIRVRVGVGSH